VLEAALVMPVLTMLTFGACQYGYLIYLKSTLQSAAAAGARASVARTATNTNVTTLVTNMMTAAGISSSKYTLTLNPTDVSSLSAGTQITVTVSSSWGTLGPGLLSAGYGGVSASKQITGVAVVQKEGT